MYALTSLEPFLASSLLTCRQVLATEVATTVVTVSGPDATATGANFNIQAIVGGAMDGRQGYRFNIRSANPIFVGIPFDSPGEGTGWRLNDQCQMVSLGSGDTFGSTTWVNGDSFVTIAKTQPNGYAPFVCKVVAVTNQLVCNVDFPLDQTPLI